MTYASLFSGAGGFDIGLDRAGLECRFQCEIDPQASKVLARHWPDVPKHTDVREVKRKHAPRVDLVVGGFPCQDLSVAGKREGLKGERSGLFYELLRVVTLCKPKFVLWENVPGLLSSDDGRDFGRVLRGLADIGYFGAWRVLDARFFGVPQRRRRVFGLFARGHLGADRCGEVLALTKGVCGDSAAGGQAGEDVAFTLTSSVGRNSGGTRAGNAWDTNYVADALRASDGRRNGHPAKGWEPGRLVPVAARCLTSRGNRNDGETDNFVCTPIDMRQASRGETMTNNRKAGTSGGAPGTGIGEPGDPSPSISLSHPPAVCVTGETTRALTAVGADASEDGTGRGTPVVAFNWNAQADQLPTEGQDVSHAAPLTCSQGSATLASKSVRRLTPRECERLMSWPDDHTRYDDTGNEFADGPRYRMCGNGVVSNCAEWIGRRLKHGA